MMCLTKFLAFCLCLTIYNQVLPIDTSSKVEKNEVNTESSEEGITLASWKIEEFADYFRMLIMIIFMCLFKMSYPLIPYVPQFLPQSLLLIIIGVIFGIIFSVVSDKKIEETLWKLTPSMFFHFLLPPIILDSAYSLYNRVFLDYLGSILIYAVFGTVLNFLIIGTIMYGLNQIGAMGSNMIEIGLNPYLLFASLIVAVDPVAVLAIFQDIGVESGLYYMVFGESLLNDAVTVVLYEIMSKFVDLTAVKARDIGLGIGSFFTISIGGFLVGVVFGIFSSLCTRWKSHFTSVFLIILAYFSYIFGDCLGWSGIISMIGCGLVQSDYAFHNMSKSSLVTIKRIVKQIAEVSEGIIFFLIGIQLFSAEIKWNTGFCLWSLVVCLVARSIVVLVLSFFMNRLRINNMQISFKQQAILIYGGLRGAVAFSLSLLIESKTLGLEGDTIKKYIVTATLFIILVTVGLMGLTMKPLVKLIKVKLATKESLSIFTNMNEHILDQTLSGIESIIGLHGRNRLRQYFTHLDDKYLRKVMQSNPKIHAERIIETYEQIALKLHFATIHPSSSNAHLRNLPQLLVKQHFSTFESIPRFNSLPAINSDIQLSEAIEEEYEQSMRGNEGRGVTFADEDDIQSVSHPEWRRRSTIIGPSGEPEHFEDKYLGMIKRKSIFAGAIKLRNLNILDEETLKNTTRNMQITKDVGSNVPHDDLLEILPERDYPTAEPPKFFFGE